MNADDRSPSKIAAPDHLERRCPRLGGTVHFFYCKSGGDNRSPCWKVFDCWWEIFDVVTYFEHRLPEAEFRRLTSLRPKPKIASILELVDRARCRTEDPAND